MNKIKKYQNKTDYQKSILKSKLNVSGTFQDTLIVFVFPSCFFAGPVFNPRRAPPNHLLFLFLEFEMQHDMARLTRQQQERDAVETSAAAAAKQGGKEKNYSLQEEEQEQERRA